jgi:hypothetical protein
VNPGVEANVCTSIERLTKLREGRKLLENKEFRIVGSDYELRTGRVRFVD